MKVFGDSAEINEDQFEALIITGDGRSELRRFQPLFDHYDEDREFLLPTQPARHISPHNRENQPMRTGWEALDAMKVYKSLSEHGYSNYLFVVDREHCEDDGRGELEDKLSDLARDEDDIEISEIRVGTYIAEFQIGSQDIILYTAVVGHEEYGFIEDCLAELLELEWGVEIQANNKDEFKYAVNSQLSGGNGRELIEYADRYHLDEAFECLSAVLQEFERSDSSD